MTFVYVAARYGEEINWEFDTLDEALESAYWDNEMGEAYPIEIRDNNKPLWTNRGGHPLVDGSCPLLERLYEYGQTHYPEIEG